MRVPWCLCDAIPHVSNETEIVIVRHHFESWRASGTARMAERALARCTIIEAGPDWRHTNELLPAGPGWLLFPDGEAVEQLGPPPDRLFVLDGTWREVRRMLRRLPALWPAPRLALPAKSKAPLRLRRAPAAEQRSTLEAIGDALEVLEGPTIAAPLAQLHQRFVEHSLRARGAWTYRGSDAPEEVPAHGFEP